MLVPHFSGKVRVFKVSGIFLKTTLVFVFILISVLSTVWYVNRVLDENERLKADLSDLRESNMEQNKLLGEKAKEINGFKQREQEISEKIKEFMDKYNEITDQYLSSRGTTDRNGNSISRSSAKFSEDMSQLRETLTVLTEMTSTDPSSITALSETEEKLNKYLDTIPTKWPAVGTLSSKYGYRKDPILWTRKLHEGIDVSAPYGNNIRASASGTVTFAGYMSGYGYAVIIDHGRGLSTLYGHSSKLVVKKGQSVKKGEIIAKIGSSGKSTGPHVHFEVRLNGSPVDPLNYLASN